MESNFARLMTACLLLAVYSAVACAAEINVNAVQDDLAARLRVTEHGGIELIRPGGVLVGIPKAMISGVVVAPSRAFIQTLPFQLTDPAQEHPTIRAEPITIIITFDIAQRDSIVQQLRGLY